MNIKETVEEDTLNMLIQHRKIAFIYFLGDYDNILNTVMLAFLSKAWNIYQVTFIHIKGFVVLLINIFLCSCDMYMNKCYYSYY